MKSHDTFSGLSRRAIVSTCATLPIFSLLLPDPARAQPETENGPALPAGQPPASDLLQSWNDTPAKKAIFDFVERVTKQDSPDYVPPAERIVTFDNDGTLWAEQPMYTQFPFARPRQGFGAAAPGLESQGTFRLNAEGRCSERTAGHH